jgi:hypothetical protein
MSELRDRTEVQRRTMALFDIRMEFDITMQGARDKVLDFNRLNWRMSLADDDKVIIRTDVWAGSLTEAVQYVEDAWLWGSSLPQPIAITIRNGAGGDNPSQEKTPMPESAISASPAKVTQ